MAPSSLPPLTYSSLHRYNTNVNHPDYNESWFDKIVERKLAMRDLVPLGDKFTGTRMPSVPVMR